MSATAAQRAMVYRFNAKHVNVLKNWLENMGFPGSKLTMSWDGTRNTIFLRVCSEGMCANLEARWLNEMFRERPVKAEAQERILLRIRSTETRVA